MKSIDILNNVQQISKMPYPVVKNVFPNSSYARMLLNDFAASQSEMSAITQYVYEHIIFNKEDLKKIMLTIAMAEMKHLDLIGELIKKLGGNPMYTNSQGKAWNSTFVSYDTGDLFQTMSFNIKAEQAAIRGYQEAIRRTRNKEIIALLKRIIMDEQSHIRAFYEIQQNIKLFKN